MQQPPSTGALSPTPPPRPPPPPKEKESGIAPPPPPKEKESGIAPPPPPTEKESGITPPPPPKEKESDITSTFDNPHRLPSPGELLAHYESQGLDTKEASLRVIGDLQAAFNRMVALEQRTKGRSIGHTSRKLESVAARLAILEKKIDDKPGYSGSLAIGVASGAALNGMGAAWSHVLGALGSIWGAVSSATKRGTPSSPS